MRLLILFGSKMLIKRRWAVFFLRVRWGSKCLRTYSDRNQLRRIVLPLKQSLRLFWGYSFPGTATCITSGSAWKDVPLRTIVYSPTSGYAIFEASFMLLAHLLMYHFAVLRQSLPSSCGVHIQQIFSQRSILSRFRRLRPQCCRVWYHQFALSTCSSRLAIWCNGRMYVQRRHSFPSNKCSQDQSPCPCGKDIVGNNHDPKETGSENS